MDALREKAVQHAISAHYVRDVQKGLSARPQRVRREAYIVSYVERPSDARTMLKGFFNIPVRA
jgi:hypothetical protein